MKVERCGFFIEGNQIYQKNVTIEWYSELTNENKAKYVKDMRDKLGKELSPCIDVTGASPIYEAKGLSLYYVKDNEGKPISQVWDRIKTFDPEEEYPGIYDFFYLKSLKPYQIGYIMDIKCFYDIYFNPQKKVNTPAKCCAMWQLLFKQKKLDYLDNLDLFWHWYWANAGMIKEVD